MSDSDVGVKDEQNKVLSRWRGAKGRSEVQGKVEQGLGFPQTKGLGQSIPHANVRQRVRKRKRKKEKD